MGKEKPSIDVKAYSLLARRSYFSKQLILKLREKEYPDEEINPLIEKLTERGWLNDQELAERYVQKKIEQGYGSSVIAFRLREKAGNVQVDVEPSEEALFAFVKKRYKKDLPGKKNKVIRALLLRGHSYDLINKVLHSIREETMK